MSCGEKTGNNFAGFNEKYLAKHYLTRDSWPKLKKGFLFMWLAGAFWRYSCSGRQGSRFHIPRISKGKVPLERLLLAKIRNYGVGSKTNFAG